MIIDEQKLFQMVDEFCVDKRPKSMDIKRMVRMCRSQTPILTAKDYQAPDPEDQSSAVKLKFAVEIFNKMMEEMPEVSMKDFLQQYIYTNDLTLSDILDDSLL